MSKTTTPRTDAVENGLHNNGWCDGLDCFNAREDLAKHARQLETELAAALDAVKRRDAEVNLLFYDKLALGCCPPHPREVCSNQESCEVCWRNWIKTKLEAP